MPGMLRGCTQTEAAANAGRIAAYDKALLAQSITWSLNPSYIVYMTTTSIWEGKVYWKIDVLPSLTLLATES